jgi:co-chaperonin GroES (HSP10)
MNHSGIQPLDLRVLVLPDPVEVKTAGGIILPDQHKEREKYAMQHGTLVAVGENAWEEAASRSSRSSSRSPAIVSSSPNTAA